VVVLAHAKRTGLGASENVRGVMVEQRPNVCVQARLECAFRDLFPEHSANVGFTVENCRIARNGPALGADFQRSD
jgi:hypothetical protein